MVLEKMYSMRSKKNELKQQRLFSIELKQSVVQKVENGEWTVLEACRIYEIKSKQTVYNWIYKYSHTLKKTTRVVVEKESADKKLRELEARNRSLEAALGRKQLELDLYRHIVDMASEEYQVDLKKNFGDKAFKDKSV